MMRKVKIGYDKYQKKDIFKLEYESNKTPKKQVFSSEDIIVGNPSSNIAIAFIYTWREDRPPHSIKEFFQRISNYAYITGYWRTTNGGRYVFSNILANPNINKIVTFVYGKEDNGHMLVDALVNFWKNGTDENGKIIGSKAQNPNFEQVTKEAEERIRKQADLVVIRKLDPENNDFEERVIKALFQEPENAERFGDSVEFYSNVIDDRLFYDDGCRFDSPYELDLSKGSIKASFSEKEAKGEIGGAIHARNLEEGLKSLASFIFNKGHILKDQRGTTICESRSLTLSIEKPLEKIPEGFSKEYVEKYTYEFLNGADEKSEDFPYTYHNRVFKKWGNQVKKSIRLLEKNPNTRRCLISLWDPSTDLEVENPPCLNFIWLCIRNNLLEMHVTYRSHHLATITKKGNIMTGEGAFVPNLYALGALQKQISEKLGLASGYLVLNDFSAHLYISEI